MRFLIDENVPRSVGTYLQERGYEVVFVEDHLGKRTPDALIALTGGLLEAIIVTFDKDFKAFAARWEVGNKRMRRLGRISFTCREPQARRRIEQLIEWIEFEYAQVQRLSDSRLIMEIADTRFSVVR